jgi:hypothetical protein
MSDRIPKVDINDFSDSALLRLANLLRKVLEEQDLKQPVTASALKAAVAAAPIGTSRSDLLNIDGNQLEQWVTPQQLAAILRISKRTLGRMRADGTGPPFSKLGRNILYHLSDVEESLKKQRFSSTAAAKREMAREQTVRPNMQQSAPRRQRRIINLKPHQT